MTVYENFPLKDILYYRIGGKARYVLKIQNKADLLRALEFVKKNNPPAGGKKTLLVGLGANLLVSDDFFDGTVIWFCKAELPQIKLLENDLVEIFAGETLEDLIQFCFKNNLRGLEWAGGLPATIGGAIRGNVGAFGSEIKDSVLRIEAVDVNMGETCLPTGRIEFLDNKSLKFSYRNSLIRQNKNLIVLSVVFKLSKTDVEGLKEAKKIYLENINYRKEHHPMDLPSCGSVFKNIIEKDKIEKIIAKWPNIRELMENKWFGKVSIGYIIGRLGFSNFTIGGARVFEKQANFIVNFNNAKFDDVISIIEKIKEKFFQTFGFYPELEIEMVK